MKEDFKAIAIIALIFEIVILCCTAFITKEIKDNPPSSFEELPMPAQTTQVPPLEGIEEIDSYVETVSDFFGLDPYIVKALIFYESRYDRFAYNEATGATGLMQIDPKWHYDRMERLEVYNLCEPYGNILVGCDYLNELLEKTGDIKLALMMYNMNHKTAKDLYGKGIVSAYARNILERAEKLRNGEITSAQEA